MDKFEYIITSSPDREKLSCEIYYFGEILAEVSQETSQILLEIYPTQKGRWWQIPLEDFQEAVSYAKNCLLL